jgi:hypothetical protein
MRHTVFEFAFRLANDDAHSALEIARAAIAEFEGVANAQVVHGATGTEMRVAASFEDGDSAQKLHRKIMNRLIKAPGVTISSVHSNLTEIFG